MGQFTKDPDRLRPCEGTCGRITRNSKMLAKDHKDTVVRANATHCQLCLREVRRADGTYTAPVSTAKTDQMKEKIAEQRLAAAARAREQLVVERGIRARRRMARPVGMGQTMVRI